MRRMIIIIMLGFVTSNCWSGDKLDLKLKWEQFVDDYVGDAKFIENPNTKEIDSFEMKGFIHRIKFLIKDGTIQKKGLKFKAKIDEKTRLPIGSQFATPNDESFVLKKVGNEDSPMAIKNCGIEVRDLDEKLIKFISWKEINYIRDLIISPDNSSFILYPGLDTTSDEYIIFYFTKKGELLWKYNLGFYDLRTSFTFSPDGEYIAGCDKKYMYLFNRKGLVWKKGWDFNAHMGKRTVLSQNAEYIIYYVWRDIGNAYLVCMNKRGEQLWKKKVGTIRSLAMSDNGDYVVIFVTFKGLTIFNGKDGSQILDKSIKDKDFINMFISDNGRYLIGTQLSKGGKIVTLYEINKVLGK